VRRQGLGWVYGGMLFCFSVLGLGWLAVDMQTADPSAGIHAAALVLLVLFAIATQLEWRATGRAAGCHASTAAWLLAAAHALALPTVAIAPVMSVLRWMLYLLAAVWLTRAFVSRDVDTKLRPESQLVVAAGVSALLAGVAWVVADTQTLTHLMAVGVPELSAAAAWAVAGAIGLVDARRRGVSLTAWVAWLAIAQVAVNLGRYLASTRSEAWLVFTGEAAILALFLAVGGAIYALFQSTLARRERLHEVMLEQCTYVDDQRRTERERAHEIRTALLAIEGATATLRREYVNLEAECRARLEEAIGAEIDHLRDLTAPRAVRTEPLDVYAVVEQQAVLSRSPSMSVEVRGDRNVGATGQRCAVVEALDNLFANAERYASRDGHVAVTIDVGRDNGSAIVHFEDNGPGIPDGWRHLIFERGWYGNPRSGGEGIGLPVSRQLLRELGGDLRLATPNDRGAAFVLSLPVADDDAGPVLNEAQDGAQVIELHGGLAVRLVHRPATAGVMSIVQDDRDVSGDGGGLERDDGQVEPRLPDTVAAHDVASRRPRDAPVPSRIVADRVVEDDGHLDVVPKEHA
jgi:signal transduction histidine kinase